MSTRIIVGIVVAVIVIGVVVFGVMAVLRRRGSGPRSGTVSVYRCGHDRNLVARRRRPGLGSAAASQRPGVRSR
jgi:hypothetical protein